MLPAYTTEERATMLGQARAAQIESIAQGTRLYQQHHPEDSNWVELAKARGLRLAQGYLPPTASKLQKFAQQLGFEKGDWEEGFFGVLYKGSVAKAIKEHNDRLPDGKKESLRIMQGYLLEQVK